MGGTLGCSQAGAQAAAGVGMDALGWQQKGLGWGGGGGD